MKSKNRFEETKIKMVMKLRGLTREAAIRELHLDRPTAEVDAGGTKHSTARGDHLMTAKEFFGEIDDDDDEMITAEEFFVA